MAHWVKCYFCGKVFDADKEEYIMATARRYAHKSCAENYIDYKGKIHSLMKGLLGVEYSASRIENQIKRIKDQEKTTEEEIYKTLDYWYNILNNSTEKANGGIGIVPFILGQYRKWAADQESNSRINKNKKINDYVGETIIVEGRIEPIKKPRHVKYYELS